MPEPPVPPEAVDAVARYLHDEVAECVGGTTKECGRWKSPAHVRHVDYYREMAAAVLQVAVPAIRADERERMLAAARDAISRIDEEAEADDYGRIADLEALLDEILATFHPSMTPNASRSLVPMSKLVTWSAIRNFGARAVAAADELSELGDEIQGGEPR